MKKYPSLENHISMFCNVNSLLRMNFVSPQPPPKKTKKTQKTTNKQKKKQKQKKNKKTIDIFTSTEEVYNSDQELLVFIIT